MVQKNDINMQLIANKKIFITGGAGYVGSALLHKIMAQCFDCQITVYDSLLFNNGNTLFPFIGHPSELYNGNTFKFIKGDIRNLKLLGEAIKGHDVVIHLAALVGYPLCREKGQTESTSVNVLGTNNIIALMSPDQYLLYGSTGSNYGEVIGVCTEETPLNPLSIYGETKTSAERLVMDRPNSTAFRFATAFGVSPRLRLDLLINDLTYQVYTQKYANIFEPHFLRTFIHIKDMAEVFLFAINNFDKMKNNVYNVGSDSMNFSKKEICEIIRTEMPFHVDFNYSGLGEDPDKRNYKVSYKKISSLGYITHTTIQEGIKELIKSFSMVKISSPYHNNGF
jgi:nucleoside-diphosphate-sugar epimerase